MDYIETSALIDGIIYSDSSVKQDLGRRFAVYLGLTPGSAGADDGIDGEGEINGEKIYFQSKLSRKSLDASYVADFWGNISIYQASIGVLLAGVGYTPGFMSKLNKCPNIDKLKIHLLTLEDVFTESSIFAQAVLNLPPLRDLSSGEWARFK